jgi:hypothetical protein
MLTEKKAEQLKKMPHISQRIFKTKDGRFLVHQTRISTVRPLEYYEKVVENNQEDLSW